MSFQMVSAQIPMNYKDSDVKIFCEGQVFHCHRSVLTKQSEVFERMLTCDNMKEATSGEININDIEDTYPAHPSNTTE